MRLSSIEEYGLRCLLHVARSSGEEPVSVPQIAEAEGLSPEYAAKLLRVLREADLVTSTRGAAGGYRLARPAPTITVLEILTALDGPIFPDSWCNTHTGRLETCVHSTDCSIRSLLRSMGAALEEILGRVTLGDLAGGERHADRVLGQPHTMVTLEGGR